MPHSPFSYVLSGTLASLAVLSCSEPDVNCAPLPPWAVAVDVRDSVSDVDLNEGAAGAVQLGNFTDSLHAEQFYLFPHAVLLGGYQEGIVEVRVERPGYANWVATGVRTRLTAGECPQWETQHLTARLQPE